MGCAKKFHYHRPDYYQISLYYCPNKKNAKKKKKKAINGEERDLLHYHYFMN